MTAKLRTLAGAAVLFAGAYALAADVPPASATKAAAADIAALKKKLTGLAADPKKGAGPGGHRTAKALALMLTVYGDDAAKGQAGEIVGSLAKKDYKAAAAAGEKLGEKGGGAAPALDGKYDLEDVMSPFRLAKSGGLNIEKDIQDGAKGKGPAAADAEVLGVRSMALAELTAKLPNAAATTTPAKTKDWEKLSADMGKAGKELADEAAKGAGANATKITAAMKKLNASCTNCHNNYRE